jgi:hypothetical protein
MYPLIKLQASVLRTLFTVHSNAKQIQDNVKRTQNPKSAKKINAKPLHWYSWNSVWVSCHWTLFFLVLASINETNMASVRTCELGATLGPFPFSILKFSVVIGLWVSRDSSVGITLGYGLDDRGSRVRFPAGAGNFSLHHRVQNGSGAHPASYPIALSLGTRRPGREADHSPPSSVEVK